MGLVGSGEVVVVVEVLVIVSVADGVIVAVESSIEVLLSGADIEAVLEVLLSE